MRCFGVTHRCWWLADPLTKSEADDDEVLHRPMISNRFCIHATAEQKDAKKREAMLRGD